MSRIGCSVFGCNEPVIGQCQGYREPCGRFYCHVHSDDKFCDTCATVKKTEELIREYENTAKQVKPSFWGHLAFGYFVILGIGGIPIILLASTVQKNINQLIALSALVYIIVLMSIAIAVPIKMYKDKERSRLSEACRRLDRFQAFYADWKKENRKAAIMTLGVVAAGVVIGTIAASVGNSRERDLREIKDRISRLE